MIQLVVLIFLYLIVSVGILIGSMLVASNLGGGIEFGSVQTVIPKAAALIVASVAVSFIPYVGFWLTIPVWWFGLMWLFRLDFGEVWLLVLINWGLTRVAFLILSLALLHSGT